MKKSMTITYTVGDGLYVNVTNRCSNRCSFCIRNNGDGAYGSDSLWLEQEPTAEQIIDAIEGSFSAMHKELVFCGYGEPSYRLRDIESVVKAFKENHPGVKVRINTNGHSDLIFGGDSAPFYSVFDTVSISLNAPTKDKYNEICKPIFAEDAFDSIIKFASKVKNYAGSVVFSVVDHFISDEEIEECKKIAGRCAIPLRVRAYIE